MNFRNMNMNELKALCRQRGINAGGSKAGLIQRLDAYKKCSTCTNYQLNLTGCSKCKKNACSSCIKTCQNCRKSSCKECSAKCNASSYCSTIDCCNTRFSGKKVITKFSL